MKQLNRTHIPTLFAMLGSTFLFWNTALLAGQITIAWDANPDPTVGGYRIYYRQIGQSYLVVDVGNQTNFTLSDLKDGKAFCIAATAYNVARTLESGFSNEVCKQLPPALQDMNGDGTADLAGLTSAGQIWYTLDRRTWTNIPGQLSQLVAGDLNADGRADLAGVNGAGQIWYTLDRRTWTNISGWLNQINIRDLNGDGRADIVGLSVRSIYYTTNLSIWTNIPGQLTALDGNP